MQSFSFMLYTISVHVFFHCCLLASMIAGRLAPSDALEFKSMRSVRSGTTLPSVRHPSSSEDDDEVEQEIPKINKTAYGQMLVYKDMSIPLDSRIEFIIGEDVNGYILDVKNPAAHPGIKPRYVEKLLAQANLASN